MVKFEVTGLEDDQDDFINPDGTAKVGHGGTEMMRDALFKRLEPELKEKFEWYFSRVRDKWVDPTKNNILWLHDTFNDPEAQHLKEASSRERFKKLVFVSQYEFQTYHLALGVPYSESVVLRNAIDPIPEHKKEKSDTFNLIYHTTPHRGLEVLVPVIDFLVNKGKKIHLDVYSSFKMYGWENRDEPYQKVFEKIKAHDNMTYHGYQPNDVIRKALKKAHMFAYPNIWPETSCIAMIEAMSAGCTVIHPNYCALSETGSNFGVQYGWEEEPNKHANKFCQILDAVMEDYWSKTHQQKLSVQKKYIDSFYNWDIRLIEWKALLNSLLPQ